MGNDCNIIADNAAPTHSLVNSHKNGAAKPNAIDITMLKTYQDQFGEDGPEMMSQFIELFFENAPEVLAEMQQAIAQRDTQTIRRAAHSLKGNGITFGAMYFSELCYQLEKHTKSGSLQGVEEMANDIQQEFNRCRQELSHYLETLQAAIS